MAKLADLNRTLNLVFGPRYRVADRVLPVSIAMTDIERSASALHLIDAMPLGSAIILRHPERGMLAKMAEAAVPLARSRRCRVLIAGDARLALAYGADGVHVPEALLKRELTVRSMRLRPSWIITAAAHNPAALRRAERAGVDGVLLSPVMPTRSHPDRAPLGVHRFRAMCASVDTAVYGLGGLTLKNLIRLKGSGAVGVAGIGLFLGK